MIDTFIDFATQNQLLSGLVGASAVGAAAIAARSLPRQILGAARWAFTVELDINSHDDFFGAISEWLANHESTRRVRRLRAGGNAGSSGAPQPAAVGSGDAPNVYLAPGEGWHFLRHNGAWIWYQHRIDHDGSKGLNHLRQFITLRVFGRSQRGIRSLVESVIASRQQKAGLDVHIWTDRYWMKGGRKSLRPMSTVLSPNADAILDYARWFFEADDWYTARGLPYRCGFEFEGEPGTGKTSMVMALATELKRPIYALNLGSFYSDELLLAAFNSTPAGAILLIEDIDAAQAAQVRKVTADGEDPEPQQGISTSALLNAIDGVAAADGRLLIVTTNHHDKLDPALIRPGRIDRRFHFTRIDRNAATQMLDRFFPEADVTWSGLNGLDFPATPATVQGRLMQLHQERAA